jgi:hypothetical protein
VLIDYARKIGEMKAKQAEDMALMANQIFITGASAGSISGGSNVVFGRMTGEPNAEKVELDKRRHAKIFIHFAKMFVERFPKWEIVLDETDPFHKARIMRKSDGVVIHNLYPDNQVAVFGGPAAWTEPLKELGQALPVRH